MTGTARRAYRLEEDVIRMIEALSYLHDRNATEALREAVRRYYADEAERMAEIETHLREIHRVAEGAADA